MPQKAVAQHDGRTVEQVHISRVDANDQAKEVKEDDATNSLQDSAASTAQARSSGPTEKTQVGTNLKSSKTDVSQISLGIDKPLNLSRLTRSKAPSNEENQSLAKPTNTHLERLKHKDTASSRLHSPRPQRPDSMVDRQATESSATSIEVSYRQHAPNTVVSPALQLNKQTMSASGTNQSVDDGNLLAPNKLSRTRSPVPAYTAWPRTNMLSESNHTDLHSSSEPPADDYSLDGNATLVAEEAHCIEKGYEYDIPISADDVNLPIAVPYSHNQPLIRRQKSVEELHTTNSSTLVSRIRKEDDVDAPRDFYHPLNSKRLKGDRSGQIDDTNVGQLMNNFADYPIKAV